MNRFVVDASVAVKWLVPEIHADAAFRLLEKNNRLTAPDLIFPEIGNVLLKKIARRRDRAGCRSRNVD